MNLKLDIPHNYIAIPFGFSDYIIVPYAILESMLNAQQDVFILSGYKEDLKPLFESEGPISLKLFTKEQIEAIQFKNLAEN